MIQLNTARFARLSRWLEWEKAQNGNLFIRFPENQLSLHTLFYVHPQIQFKHIVMGMNFPETGVAYPQGVSAQSLVMGFLMEERKAGSVEFTLRNGEKKYLRNKACDRQLHIIRSITTNPKSIYGYLSNYIASSQPQPPSSTPQPQSQSQSEQPEFEQPLNISGKINYFLNQFYMRLTAQTYCKMRGIKTSQLVDEKVKSQVMDFIGEEYENHSPAAIRKVYLERDIILEKIEETKREIQAIEDQGDRKIKFYKYGAIIITIAHILSFGYMIFFVDWLGWDIIEPLTYSVGVAYTLLGIRFYRKYRTDRTGDSIREILLKIIMKPQKIVMLKDFKFRLRMQEVELKRIQTRARLLKNRINFRSSLADAYTRKIQDLEE